MKLKQIFILAAVVSSGLLTGCKNDNIYASDFDNAVFIDSQQHATTILVKAGIKDFSQNLQVASAKKVAEKVTITYAIDENMVSLYNSAYYDNAIMLPAECYDMPVTEAVMSANSALSTPVEVNFKNLEALDRETHYVLPIKLEKVVGAKVLASAKNHYYVFKGAALINVVGDVDENYLTVNWKNPSVVNGLRTFTIEGLLRARNFDKMISTFMGIEGKFLLRFGDLGFPGGQLQATTSANNFWPDANPAKVIPTNKWVHVAFTYDNGTVKIYIDGKIQSTGVRNWGTISLGEDNFYIGKSYDNTRYWPGEMSEVRIWNVVRTEEQIANNIYYVDPATQGLVAYWKFDEGVGSLVKDYTSNGNNAVANAPMKWTKLSLPAFGK